MKTISKACLNCNNTFDALLKEHNRGYGKFCGRSCSSQYNKPKMVYEPNVACATCNKCFYKTPSRIKLAKHGYHFCSRSCKDKAQRMNHDLSIPAIHPPHYIDGTNKTRNYRKVALFGHDEMCNRCGYDKHVRLLQVHHKDRDRLNNTLENLEVLCIRCHHEEHMEACDGPYTKYNKEPVDNLDGVT